MTHLVGRRPPLRVAYNGSMFALAALAGGLAIEPIPETSVGGLLAARALRVHLQLVNIVMISAVLAVNSGKPVLQADRREPAGRRRRSR